MGIEVSKCKKSIFLFQKKYVLELLAKTGKLSAKLCNPSMTYNLQLITENSELFENSERYKRLVGKLNYFTVTYPYIVYSLSVVS